MERCAALSNVSIGVIRLTTTASSRLVLQTILALHTYTEITVIASLFWLQQ